VRALLNIPRLVTPPLVAPPLVAPALVTLPLVESPLVAPPLWAFSLGIPPLVTPPPFLPSMFLYPLRMATLRANGRKFGMGCGAELMAEGGKSALCKLSTFRLGVEVHADASCVAVSDSVWTSGCAKLLRLFVLRLVTNHQATNFHNVCYSALH
jgi:hypothetical protein